MPANNGTKIENLALYRLSERDYEILAAVEQQAMAPLALVAKSVGCRDNVLAYAIRSLKAKGVISDKIPLIDFYRLGYVDCTIALTLSPVKRQTHQAFTRYVKGARGLLWFAELSGEYQYWISLCISGPLEAHAFLSAIAERFGDIVHEKEITLRVSFVSFGRKYLSKNPKSLPCLAFGGQQLQVPIDTVDRRILSTMCNQPFDSKRGVARALGLAVTTVERRIARMEKEAVITGYFYRFSSEALDVSTVKLLLYTHGIAKNLAKALYRFCLQHPRVRNFSQCSGAWDYELNVEARSLRDVSAVVQDLLEYFGPHIVRVRQLPVVSSIKFSGYPFAEEAVYSGPQ